jgi:hypothetical protein
MSEEQKKPQQDEKGRFVTGNSGGGRPKGSRNKLGEMFLEDMLASWEREGCAAISRVIDKRPQDYLKIVASLMPREMNVNHTGLEDLSDDQLLRKLQALMAMAKPFLDELEGHGGIDTGTPPSRH